MNELQHHGIQGQKWGIRRFQNPDGTWTDEGKKRYAKESKTKDEYRKIADKHKQRAKTAGKISVASALATIPASLITVGMTAAATCMTPAALGALSVSVLLSGTASVSKTVAIGEAALSALNYRRAKKLEE